MQDVDQLGDGLVGAVADLVPVEGAQVVVGRLCHVSLSIGLRRWAVWAIGKKRTVIDHLLLGDLVVVIVEERAQRVADLGHEALARSLQLAQVVSLLDQSIEGSYLEVGHGEGQNGAIIGADGGLEGVERFGLVAGIECLKGQRDEAILGRCRGHFGRGREGVAEGGGRK